MPSFIFTRFCLSVAYAKPHTLYGVCGYVCRKIAEGTNFKDFQPFEWKLIVQTFFI